MSKQPEQKKQVAKPPKEPAQYREDAPPKKNQTAAKKPLIQKAEEGDELSEMSAEVDKHETKSRGEEEKLVKKQKVGPNRGKDIDPMTISIEDSDDEKQSKTFVLWLKDSVSEKELTKLLRTVDPTIELYPMPHWRGNFGRMDVQNAVDNTYLPQELADEGTFLVVATHQSYLDQETLRKTLEEVELKHLIFKSKKFLDHEQLKKNMEDVAKRVEAKMKKRQQREKEKLSSGVSKKSTALPKSDIEPFRESSQLPRLEPSANKEFMLEMRLVKEALSHLQADVNRLFQMVNNNQNIFQPSQGIIARLAQYGSNQPPSRAGGLAGDLSDS